MNTITLQDEEVLQLAEVLYNFCMDDIREYPEERSCKIYIDKSYGLQTVFLIEKFLQYHGFEVWKKETDVKFKPVSCLTDKANKASWKKLDDQIAHILYVRIDFYTLWNIFNDEKYILTPKGNNKLSKKVIELK